MAMAPKGYRPTRLDPKFETRELAKATGLFVLALAAGVLLISPPVLLVVFLTKGWKGWWRALSTFFIAEMVAAFFIVRSYYRKRKAHYNTG